jgi:hypothetical protein
MPKKFSKVSRRLSKSRDKSRDKSKKYYGQKPPKVIMDPILIMGGDPKSHTSPTINVCINTTISIDLTVDSIKEYLSKIVTTSDGIFDETSIPIEQCEHSNIHIRIYSVYGHDAIITDTHGNSIICIDPLQKYNDSIRCNGSGFSYMYDIPSKNTDNAEDEYILFALIHHNGKDTPVLYPICSPVGNNLNMVYDIEQHNNEYICTSDTFYTDDDATVDRYNQFDKTNPKFANAYSRILRRDEDNEMIKDIRSNILVIAPNDDILRDVVTRLSLDKKYKVIGVSLVGLGSGDIDNVQNIIYTLRSLGYVGVYFIYGGGDEYVSYIELIFAAIIGDSDWDNRINNNHPELRSKFNVVMHANEYKALGLTIYDIRNIYGQYLVGELRT